jgi:signal transduction histidine kinase
MAYRCGALLFILALSSSGFGAATGSGSSKKVLMLFSEGTDLPGTVVVEEAVRDELQKNGTNTVEVFAEHLDARHFPDAAHLQLFRDYLGKKYAGQKLDLIVPITGRDFYLVQGLPAAVFPNVPVTFAAVNELDIPAELDRPGMRGIVERFDVQGTVEMMLRLEPDTRRIIVIGGVSEFDRRVLERVEHVAKSMESITFEFWTNRPMAELKEAVKTLGNDASILLCTVRRDSSGQAFMMSQVAPILSPAASVSVYVLSGAAIGTGAVGGAVADPKALGETVGALALEALEGTPMNGPAIQVRTNGTPVVDWRELKRWRIDARHLPAGCEIRYKPVSLWEEHYQLIIAALVVFVAQAITIAALLAQRARRRTAEAEVATQRAELAHVSRVSTVGQLASALAHELNQPLGAILRNAEAAELFLQQPQPNLDEVRAIVADIRQDDQRAGAVIERMRALLKRRILELKLLNLCDVLRETIAVVRPDAKARQVNLSLDMPTHPLVVRGDRVQIQQVVLNLILNGMDAMNGSGGERSVVVEARAGSPGWIEVGVKDSGSGLPPEGASRIFNPFFTTKANGMGMGLAISRTIIEAHGGKIQAANNADRGCTVRFTLPAGGSPEAWN